MTWNQLPNYFLHRVSSKISNLRQLLYKYENSCQIFFTLFLKDKDLFLFERTSIIVEMAFNCGMKVLALCLMAAATTTLALSLGKLNNFIQNIYIFELWLILLLINGSSLTCNYQLIIFGFKLVFSITLLLHFNLCEISLWNDFLLCSK